MPNSDQTDRRSVKPRRVRRASPTLAELNAGIAKRDAKAKPVAKPVPVRVLAAKSAPAARKITKAQQKSSRRSERASERPDADAVVKTFKQSDAYIDAYQDARAAGVKRKRVALVGPKQSARAALGHRDVNVTLKRVDGTVDEPRSSAEIRRFLATGQRPRTGAEAALKKIEMDTAAPALKILEQTTRPVHAVAGATDAALTGKSVLRAASRGIQNKDKVLFSDVLKHAGAPKAVQTVGGLALDVGLDPTTYVTGGTGAVAKQAARREAARISAKAVKAGLSKETAERMGARAGERAAAKAPAGRGVTVRFAGREVPGVRAGTARVAQTTKRSAQSSVRVIDRAGAAVTPARAKKYVKGKRDLVGSVGPGAKNLVRDVRPTLTPAGMDRAEFAAVHDAAAAARGRSAAATEHAQRFAKAVQKHVPDAADQARVIDAIERQQIGKLPERLRQPAVRVRSELRGQRRAAVRSGVAIKQVERGRQAGDAKAYFPHALDDALKAGDGVVDAPTVAGVGRRTIKLASTSKRADRRPISKINAETEGKFSTDLPLVLANHLATIGTAASRATFNRELAKVGREVKFGPTVSLKDDEALYAIKGSDIKTVKPGDARVEGARYFAINRELAESELASLRGVKETTAVGRAFNQSNRGFKRLATLTPAFHIRNAIGDTQLAYLSQPGHRLAVNTGQAGKILAAGRREGKQIDRLAFPKASGKTIKVAGKRVPVEEVLRESRDNAATQTGYIGRELHDLVGRDESGAVKKVRRGSGKLEQTLQARENLMRVGTFKHALDEGKTAGKAARVSRRTHIDYGDLTKFEQQARRVLPFYTFSARSVPLHAEKLITHPGKFSQYEKAREEGAAALGLRDGYEGDQSEYQQRLAALPLGADKLLSAGLPLPSALNELPAGLSLNEYGAELGNFLTSMLTPGVKVPIELQTGKNTFSRSDIEPRGRTLVPAPEWVKILPKKARDELGVTSGPDTQTGKTVLKWPAKTNYKVKQILIGPAGQASQLSTVGTNQRGQPSGREKTVSVLSGVKIDKVDKDRTEVTRLYDELEKTSKAAGDVKAQGRDMDRDGYYTPAYERLLDTKKSINARIDELEARAGKPKVKRGKRRKVRRAATGGSWGGGSSKGSGGGDPWGGASGSSAPSDDDPWGG